MSWCAKGVNKNEMSSLGSSYRDGLSSFWLRLLPQGVITAGRPTRLSSWSYRPGHVCLWLESNQQPFAFHVNSVTDNRSNGIDFVCLLTEPGEYLSAMWWVMQLASWWALIGCFLAISLATHFFKLRCFFSSGLIQNSELITSTNEFTFPFHCRPFTCLWSEEGCLHVTHYLQLKSMLL